MFLTTHVPDEPQQISGSSKPQFINPGCGQLFERAWQ